MDNLQSDLDQFPTPENFLLRTPLYKKFAWPADPSLVHNVWRKIDEVLNHWRPIDAFCPACGLDSMFQGQKPNHWFGEGATTPELPTYLRPGSAPEIHQVSLMCNRDNDHTLVVIFRVGPDAITKIGQYPSLADLARDELRVYRRALGPFYVEFNRAVGLAAHDVGIGAFVYLRRVFESLLREAEEQALKDGAVSVEALGAARIDDKISLLADFLPPRLVENRTLYGILSKGLHELGEEECRNHFGVVRAGIEIILEEKVQKARRIQRAEKISKEVAALNRKIAERG